MPVYPLVIVSAIGVVIYALIVIIFWRNVGFSQPWKTAFSFSVFLVFVAAMVFNIWLVDTYAPWLLEILDRTKDHGNSALVAFVISTPIATLITVAWYLMFRALDKTTKVDELKWNG